MRLLLCLCFCLPVYAVAIHPLELVQAPSLEDLQHHLASTVESDRAWAAFRLNGETLAACRQQLTDRLASILLRGEPETDRSLPYICDALIRARHGSLPKGLIEVLGQYQQTSALIIASLDLEANRSYLHSLIDGHGRKGLPWISAVNLLAADGDRQLYNMLLSAIPLQLQITVTAPGNDDRYGQRFGISRGCGGRRLRSYAGFPPPVAYQLSARAPDEVTWQQLCIGPETVHYTRHVGTVVLSARGSQTFDSIQYTVNLLRSLVETEDLRLTAYRTATVQVTARQEIMPAVSKQIHAYRQEYRKWVTALVEHNMLEAEDAATLEPSIAVSIENHHEGLSLKAADFPSHWTVRQP